MTATTGSLSRIVTSGDAELYVEQHGSGPDVLLLNGLGDTVEAWQAQTQALADRYRLTVYDTRGVGRTHAPVGSISVPAFAEDATVVIEAMGLDRPHVMGFSGGGIVAQELAITRPDLVRSLVLCGTFSGFDELAHRKIEIWLHLAATRQPREFMRSFLASIYSRAAHADGRVDAWIDEMLAFPHPMSDDAFVASLEAYQAHETTSRLDRIAAPTLVIAGDEDPVAPPSYSRDIAARVQGAELVVMRDQAHQPFQEVPDEYNALVSGFWERVAS